MSSFRKFHGRLWSKSLRYCPLNIAINTYHRVSTSDFDSTGMIHSVTRPVKKQLHSFALLTTSQSRASAILARMESRQRHFSCEHYSTGGGLFTGRLVAKTPASHRPSEMSIAAIVQCDSNTARYSWRAAKWLRGMLSVSAACLASSELSADKRNRETLGRLYIEIVYRPADHFEGD